MEARHHPILFIVLQLAKAEEQNRRPFGTQLFPFRTVAMILSLVTIPLISQLMVYLFKSNTLKKNQDIFLCVVNISDAWKNNCEMFQEFASQI